MSTRATYKFTSTHHQYNNHAPVVFYIHHNGYPTGAMQYFVNALNCENKRGSFADQFFRSNDGAELTTTHQGHIDTEFRYDIHQKSCGTITIRCTKKNYETDTWDKECDYTLDEYINYYRMIAKRNYEQYVKSAGDDDFIAKKLKDIDDILPSKYMFIKGRYVCEKILLQDIAEKTKEYKNYKKRFPDNIGNLNYHKKMIEGLEEDLKKFKVQDITLVA